MKDKFETGVETILSMCTAHLTTGRPDRRAVVSNLRLFAKHLAGEIDMDEQEGKSLDELAGKGEIAHPQSEEEIMAPATFPDGLHGFRSDIELIKKKVANWMVHPELTGKNFSSAPLDHTREMHANLKLAYRHLEDARMRLGKVLQAYDGGTSIYDKEKSQ